jgi:hypothetical protein
VTNSSQDLIHQIQKLGRRAVICRLKIEVSLVIGAWNLELHWSLDVGAWDLELAPAPLFAGSAAGFLA